jgi:hypothetical protein
MSMSDELKERNISKLISIVRFACATLDVGHSVPLPHGHVNRRIHEPFTFYHHFHSVISFQIIGIIVLSRHSPQFDRGAMTIS